MEAFADFINAQIKALGGEERGAAMRLAERLDVNVSQVYKWQNGQDPRWSTVVQVLSRLGGNIARALPTYTPPSIAAVRLELEREYANHTEPIIHAGNVTGGILSATDRSTAADEDRMSFADIWRDSPMWPYCNHAEPVIVVTVRGTSMEPNYPDGSMIALGRFAVGQRLPQGSPCVFATGQGEHTERTFKLYRSTTDNVVIGWPLNPEHPPIIFKRQPTIEFVVLGLCNPRPQPEVQPGSDLLSKLKGRQHGTASRV